MNLANQQGLQGGVTGATACYSRAPVTDFMAEMMVAPLLLAGGVARASAAAERAQLLAISLPRALV